MKTGRHDPTVAIEPAFRSDGPDEFGVGPRVEIPSQTPRPPQPFSSAAIAPPSARSAPGRSRWTFAGVTPRALEQPADAFPHRTA